MTQEEAIKLLDATAAKLGEHFDHVQILTSRMVEDSTGPATQACIRGCGDWFARKGLAHAFIEGEMAEQQGREVARAIKDE